MAQDFRKLIVWKNAHKLTLDVYGVTKNFPKEEKYGLTQQIRRSVCSIELNIAEGTIGSNKRFKNYLIMAIGSCKETECNLLICKDLDFLKENEHDNIYKKTRILQAQLQNLIKLIKVPN